MIGREGPGPERPGPDYPPEWDDEPEEVEHDGELLAANLAAELPDGVDPVPCRDCGRIRREDLGERHTYPAGLDEDGELLDLVCLDAAGRQLDPAPVIADPWGPPPGPDPWAMPGPVPPPPF